MASKQFRVMWNTKNSGHRAVRVVDLPFEAPSYDIERVGLELGDGSAEERSGTGTAPALVPFRPFVLRPGEYREVTFTDRFRDCPFPPSSGVSQHPVGEGSSIPVESSYQVWGLGGPRCLRNRRTSCR